MLKFSDYSVMPRESLLIYFRANGPFEMNASHFSLKFLSMLSETSSITVFSEYYSKNSNLRNLRRKLASFECFVDWTLPDLIVSNIQHILSPWQIFVKTFQKTGNLDFGAKTVEQKLCWPCSNSILFAQFAFVKSRNHILNKYTLLCNNYGSVITVSLR